MLIPLVDSPYLRTVAPIVSNATPLLTPASFASWAACWAAHSDKTHFRFGPGDYDSWGAIEIDGASGSALDPRTIRYEGPNDDLHPCKRTGSASEARLHAFRFVNGSQHWQLQGVTMRAQGKDAAGTESVVSTDAGNIVIDKILVEQSRRVYGIRLLDVSDIWVQRSVFLDRYLDPENLFRDSVAVQTFPNTGLGMGNIWILDNECRNYGDFVGCAQNAADEFVPSWCVIEGNDAYITEAEWIPGSSGTMAYTENAVDLKAGDDDNPTIIRNNRFSGFRRNGVSATGDAIVVHRASQNTGIFNNYIADCPIGVVESAWIAAPIGPADPQTPRDITVEGNYFHRVRAFHASDRGACVQMVNNMTVRNNVAALCDYVFYDQVANYVAGGPTFTGNRRMGTSVRHPSSLATSKWVESSNLVDVRATRDCHWIQRNRWTGPYWEPIPRQVRSLQPRV